MSVTLYSLILTNYQAALQLILVANMDADEVLRSFAKVNATSDVQHRPIGGTTYVYQWSDSNKKHDWRADGYRWRQVGSAKPMKSSSTNRATQGKKRKRFKTCLKRFITYETF